MATNTTNYGFKKPDESDFYDVADQNKNWDLADEALKNLDTPTFEDYTGSTAVPSATDAIDQIKSKGKLGTLLSNIKAAFKGACLIGHIVNNCVTDNAGLPLSAAQGKVLKDLYTQLYSDLNTTNNNLSNKFKNTADNGYTQLSQLMDVGAWNKSFVFDIPYTSSLAPSGNNTVGIAERGMLHAFDYTGKHYYCIDSATGWQESPYALKSDLTPDFKKIGSGYGLEAYHAAIGGLHILRLAGNVTSDFSNFDLALPDSCNGYFISEPGKTGNISYTIEINNKHLIITPDTSIAAGTYFVHWLIYYG